MLKCDDDQKQQYRNISIFYLCRHRVLSRHGTFFCTYVSPTEGTVLAPVSMIRNRYSALIIKIIFTVHT